jgi:hypothetical protein
LKLDPRWRLVYDDGEALYFERAAAAGGAVEGSAEDGRAGNGLQAAKN